MWRRLEIVLPVLAEVAELVQALVDCADDGSVTPQEAARLAQAISALAERLRARVPTVKRP